MKNWKCVLLIQVLPFELQEEWYTFLSQLSEIRDSPKGTSRVISKVWYSISMQKLWGGCYIKDGIYLGISSDLITSRHTLTDGNVIHLCVRFTNAILTRHTWHGHISIISKRRLPRSIKEQIIIDKILLCPARYFLTWKHAKCFSLYSFLRFFCEKQKRALFSILLLAFLLDELESFSVSRWEKRTPLRNCRWWWN